MSLVVRKAIKAATLMPILALRKAQHKVTPTKVGLGANQTDAIDDRASKEKELRHIPHYITLHSLASDKVLLLLLI